MIWLKITFYSEQISHFHVFLAFICLKNIFRYAVSKLKAQNVQSKGPLESKPFLLLIRLVSRADDE